MKTDEKKEQHLSRGGWHSSNTTKSEATAKDQISKSSRQEKD